MRETAAGGVTAVTQPGGWDRIKYGSGIKDKGLKAVETSVGISDPESTLLNMLETYDPRGSAANIDWATPGLALTDWEPGFTGIVSDWERDGLYTRLILKTDDTVLRSPVPAGIYSRAEWGSATENTIFGTAMPLVFGYHDSWQVTHRGMVAATNIRYDKDLGYWWLATVDRMVDIERVYLDGGEMTGGWTVVRGVYGSNYLTIISITPGFQPDEGVVVAFDGNSMNQIGLHTGSTLTGAPDQLRAIIEEYTFRDPPLNGWRGDHAICEDSSWDAVSAFFALHRIESAFKTRGGQEPESAAEIIDGFLTAYPWVRMWWTEKGQIAIAVIDPEDTEPTANVLDLQKHHEGGQVPYLPGDRREVYTHLRMPFMWSGAEQKYLSAYEAHDVAALPEKVALVTDNPWSQCRFEDPVGTLNPAPPADPTYPAEFHIGLLSVTLDDMTAAGTGEVLNEGITSVTLDAMTAAGLGHGGQEATLSKTLDALTLSGTGTNPVPAGGWTGRGVGYPTLIPLDDMTCAGTGTVV
jgi:hypothetical protein